MSEKPEGVWGLVTAAVGWFREATPLRKIQDLAVVAFALLLAGVAWSVYESKEAILDTVTHSRPDVPRLDVAGAADELPRLWRSLAPLGCISVAVYAVDLDSNTIELVAVEGDSQEALEAIRATGRRQTFITQDLGLNPEALRVASNMMQGDALFGSQPLKRHPDVAFPDMGSLFVPLPDEPGRLLTGVVICNWPASKGMNDASADVRTARLEILEYASRFAR